MKTEYIEIIWEDKMVRITFHTTSRLQLYLKFFQQVYGEHNVRHRTFQGYLVRDVEECRIASTLVEQATNALGDIEKEFIKEQTEKHTHLFGKPRKK